MAKVEIAKEFKEAIQYIQEIRKENRSFIGCKICNAFNLIAIYAYLIIYLLTCFGVMETPFELSILLCISVVFGGMTDLFVLNSGIRFMRVLLGIVAIALGVYFSLAYFSIVPALPFSIWWVFIGKVLIDLVFDKLGI